MNSLPKDAVEVISRYLDQESFLAFVQSCRCTRANTRDEHAMRIQCMRTLAAKTHADYVTAQTVNASLVRSGSTNVDAFPKVTDFSMVRDGMYHVTALHKGVVCRGTPTYRVGRWRIHAGIAHWTAPATIFPGQVIISSLGSRLFHQQQTSTAFLQFLNMLDAIDSCVAFSHGLCL